MFKETEYIQNNHREMKARSRMAYDTLKGTPGLTVYEPRGAFYMFPKYTLADKSIDCCADILSSRFVGLVPGISFGCEHHFRIAFSQPQARLLQGLLRIKDYFEEKWQIAKGP